jgi:hypothetical protein
MELLNENWQRELIGQPESGMGYQDVAIELRNGETRHGTAFNAKFLLYSGESPSLLQRISEPSQRSLMLETGFGPRYVVEGELDTPVGRGPRVRSVWQFDSGTIAPRLITAYPLEDS